MTRHLKHSERRTRSEIVGAPILTQISGLRRSQLRNARGSVPDDGGSAIRALFDGGREGSAVALPPDLAMQPAE